MTGGDTIISVDERVLTGRSGSPAPEDPGSPAAPAPPGAPAPPAVPPPAGVPPRWQQVPYAIVLAGVLAGLCWAWQGTAHVRAGMVTVAAALLAAALARLVLPERRVGLLAARHRLIDIAALLGLGVCILAVALVLPRPA